MRNARKGVGTLLTGVAVVGVCWEVFKLPPEVAELRDTSAIALSSPPLLGGVGAPAGEPPPIAAIISSNKEESTQEASSTQCARAY